MLAPCSDTGEHISLNRLIYSFLNAGQTKSILILQLSTNRVILYTNSLTG